jgi:hypothetical protein
VRFRRAVAVIVLFLLVVLFGVDFALVVDGSSV